MSVEQNGSNVFDTMLTIEKLPPFPLHVPAVRAGTLIIALTLLKGRNSYNEKKTISEKKNSYPGKGTGVSLRGTSKHIWMLSGSNIVGE